MKNMPLIKFIFFVLLLTLSSCMENPEITELEFNEQSVVDKLEIPKDLAQTQEDFSAVKKILRSKCLNCHSSGKMNFNFDSQEKFITEGFVSPGKLNKSSLYYRLKGAGEGIGIENMPVGSINLTAQEMKIIKDWIIALGSETVSQYTGEIKLQSKVLENDKQVILAILLDRPAKEELDIPIIFSGTALNGLDYVIESSSVRISAAEIQGSIPIAIINDEVVESDKTIKVRINTVTANNYVLSFRDKEAVATLTDDDIPTENLVGTLSVLSPGETIEEKEMEIKIQLTLNQAPREALSIPLSISGTAFSGMDYLISAPTFNIAKNTKFGEVTLNILDDDLPEVKKLIQINTPNFYDDLNKINLSINPKQVLLTLTDNDMDLNDKVYDEYTASITTTPPDNNISEKSGSLVISANLNKIATKNIKIPLGISGSVTPLNDYTLEKNFIEIPAGSKNSSVSLMLNNDNDYEPNETLDINISDVIDSTNMIKVTSTPAQIKKVLTSEDLPIIKHSASVTTNASNGFIKEDIGNLEVTVSLEKALNKNVQFNYAISGTSTLGQDFTKPSSQISIPAGMQTATINIPIINDQIEEKNETLIVTILDYFNEGDKIEVDLSSNEFQLIIQDDDALPINSEFASVKNILSKNCTYCHDHQLDGVYPIDLTSETSLASGPFVVKGNADSSKLFYKLKGAGVADPKLEVMPKFADPLSLEMRVAIKDWINGLEVQGDSDMISDCNQSSFKNGLDFKMRRLSAEEIKNSIKHLFGNQNFTKLEATINNSLPVDPNPLSEDFQPQFLNGTISAMDEIASDISLKFKNDDELFTAIAGDCATISPINDLCFENFLQRAAKSLYRRPIEADEIKNLKDLTKDSSLIDSSPLAYTKNKFMIALMHMLQSPNFLLVMDRSQYSPNLSNNPYESLGLSLDKFLIAHHEKHTFSDEVKPEIPSFSGVKLNPDEFSLLLSFTPSDLNSQNGQNPQFRIFSQSGGNSEQAHIIMVGTDNDGSNKGRILRVRIKTCSNIGSGCSTSTLKSQAPILEENTKSKIVLTFNKGNLSVYHNNNLVSLTGSNLRGPFLASDPDMGTFIGANFNGYMPLLGTIHNVIALNRVISDTERDLYHAGNFDTNLADGFSTPEAPSSTIQRNIANIEGETVAKRTQFEIASLISLVLTSSPPDEDLFAAAMAGQLSDIGVIKSHAKRIIQTDLGKKKLKGFFNNWLELFNVTSSPYSDEFLSGINDEGLHEELIEQVKSHGMKMVIEDEESFKSLMGGTKVHINSNRIASLYGLSSFNKNGKTSISPLRAGILAMPGLNLTGGYFGSLVKRGVRIRRKVLCDPIGNPTAADIEDRDDVEPNRFDHSNREYWRLFTETNPTCLSCHAATNPLGNVFENIDSIGRSRSTEVLYDSMGIATEFVYSTIDITAQPRITELDPSVVNGPGELGQLIGNSSKAQSCFARQAFHYTYKQQYDDDKHSCFIRSLENKLQSGDGKMIDMFVELVATKYALGQIQN